MTFTHVYKIDGIASRENDSSGLVANIASPGRSYGLKRMGVLAESAELYGVDAHPLVIQIRERHRLRVSWSFETGRWWEESCVNPNGVTSLGRTDLTDC